MKCVVLTSSLKGTASHHLPILIEKYNVNVVLVIYNLNKGKKKKGFLSNKLKKVFQIGLLGALNGIRIRSWYDLSRIGFQTKSIHEVCSEYDIPLTEVDSLNSDLSRSEIMKSNADIGISLGNPYISERIFSIPELGMINIHHEILPDFQNAQSVIWSIYEGKKNTGYTIHEINKKIDEGAIILQETFPLEFGKKLKDTVALTSKMLLEKSAHGLGRVLGDYYKYKSKATPQKGGKKYTTPSIKEFFRILKQHNKLTSSN